MRDVFWIFPFDYCGDLNRGELNRHSELFHIEAQPGDLAQALGGISAFKRDRNNTVTIEFFEEGCDPYVIFYTKIVPWVVNNSNIRINTTDASDYNDPGLEFLMVVSYQGIKMENNQMTFVFTWMNTTHHPEYHVDDLAWNFDLGTHIRGKMKVTCVDDACEEPECDGSRCELKYEYTPPTDEESALLEELQRRPFEEMP